MSNREFLKQMAKATRLSVTAQRIERMYIVALLGFEPEDYTLPNGGGLYPSSASEMLTWFGPQGLHP